MQNKNGGCDTSHSVDKQCSGSVGERRRTSQCVGMLLRAMNALKQWNRDGRRGRRREWRGREQRQQLGGRRRCALGLGRGKGSAQGWGSNVEESGARPGNPRVTNSASSSAGEGRRGRVKRAGRCRQQLGQQLCRGRSWSLARAVSQALLCCCRASSRVPEREAVTCTSLAN
ncbi:hypothetical protein BDV95DRAFT_70510 [Massariosphaeria phaeospora]|uniref:Uncharacterized protein n=1 Tax=Massariosphaeria phaeospora TaxID=100035 RepID=A0A7C8IE42_9PLEO|nr:hypothetical protein BDV95DRAFT_70510 [Massariosphaeria phaeospora]